MVSTYYALTVASSEQMTGRLYHSLISTALNCLACPSG